MARTGRKGSFSEFEDWEKRAIDYAARMVREPGNQEELRAELARKLLVLRARSRAGVRHWRTYASTAIVNEARRWMSRLNAEKRNVPLDPRQDEEREGFAADVLRHLSTDEGDFGVALRKFWEDLGPELRRFLLLLEEKEGNQVAVAKSLRVHRNTVALWRKKVRSIWEKHGLR